MLWYDIDHLWGISSIVLQIVLVVAVEWRTTHRLSHRWIVPIFFFMPGMLGVIVFSAQSHG